MTTRATPQHHQISFDDLEASTSEKSQTPVIEA